MVCCGVSWIGEWCVFVWHDLCHWCHVECNELVMQLCGSNVDSVFTWTIGKMTVFLSLYCGSMWNATMTTVDIRTIWATFFCFFGSKWLPRLCRLVARMQADHLLIGGLAWSCLAFCFSDGSPFIYCGRMWNATIYTADIRTPWVTFFRFFGSKWLPKLCRLVAGTQADYLLIGGLAWSWVAFYFSARKYSQRRVKFLLMWCDRVDAWSQIYNIVLWTRSLIRTYLGVVVVIYDFRG